MKFLWKKLYEDLDKWRQRDGKSWRKVAKEVGVTPSVFTRISQGNPVSVENMIRVLDSIHVIALNRWIKR
jgi:hypothetical protein